MLVALPILRCNIRRCKCISSVEHAVDRRWLRQYTEDERDGGMTLRSSHSRPAASGTWPMRKRLAVNSIASVSACHRVLRIARSSNCDASRRHPLFVLHLSATPPFKTALLSPVNEDNTKLRRTSFTYLTFGRPKRSVAQSDAYLMHLLVFDGTGTCQVLYDVLAVVSSSPLPPPLPPRHRVRITVRSMVPFAISSLPYRVTLPSVTAVWSFTSFRTSGTLVLVGARLVAWLVTAFMTVIALTKWIKFCTWGSTAPTWLRCCPMHRHRMQPWDD